MKEVEDEQHDDGWIVTMGSALSAGLCTIATDSDMGGSVRLPCAFNGLYGFKPPFSRVMTVLPLARFRERGRWPGPTPT